MESRLVLFILFLLLTVGALSLSSYKKYFNDDRSLSISNVYPNQKDEGIEKEETSDIKEEVLEVAPKKVELNTPQLERAHTIYTKTANCIKCHGQFGQGNPKEEAPLIAGQHEWYIKEQLALMKSGSRVNEKMMPYLKDLNKKDFEDLASYISKLRAGQKAE